MYSVVIYINFWIVGNLLKIRLCNIRKKTSKTFCYLRSFLT